MVAPSLTPPTRATASGGGRGGGPWPRAFGEIIGGSQREERLEVLDRNMAEHGLDREHYAPTLQRAGEG
jgi:hypothetical protein